MADLIDKHGSKGYVSLLHDKESSAGREEVCGDCAEKPLLPPRSYHCEECRKDVLMMDQHSCKISLTLYSL